MLEFWTKVWGLQKDKYQWDKLFSRRDFFILKFSFSEKATKNLRILPYGFEIYTVNVKTIRQIAKIFVAFSEKLNFNVSDF